MPKFYGADDDTRRYRDGELVGHLAAFQLPGMAAWKHISNERVKADAPLTTFRLAGVVHPASPNVEVLPLTAYELAWLEPPGPDITATRASRL